MAITSTLNLSSVSRGIGSLNSGLNRVKTSANNLKKVVLNQNRVKRQAIVGRKSLFSKREESIRRKDQEDILESSGVKGIARRTGSIIAESTKGFLGRLLDFASTLLVGWLLYNLPTILTWIKNLISRIQKLFNTLVGFFSNLINVFIDFGNILSGILYNVTRLDFLDSERKVRGAIDDLGMHFDEMGNQFEDGVKLLSTPLGQMPGEQEAAPTGTDYTTTEQGSTLTGPMKDALNIIGAHEADTSGGYNAMNQGTVADSKGNQPRSGPSKGIIKKNLTEMTIGEVIQHQSRNLTNDQGFIHAAGRYQFIGNTLPSAMKSAGLKPGDPFSPENQDRMAATLLKSRGLSPWTADPRSGYSAKERATIEAGRRSNIQFAQGVTPGGSTSRLPGASSSLAKAAQSLKGMSTRNAATSGGTNGCVYAVNAVFKSAGITPPWGNALRVSNAEAAMIKSGWREVPLNQRQAGDVIIIYDKHPTEPQIHIGIVLDNGKMISNSSSTGTFTWEDYPENVFKTYSQGQGYGKCYRMPGNTRGGGVMSSPMKDASGRLASANISPTSGQEQNLQPKRKGQQIMFIDDRQQETSQGGGGFVSDGQQLTPRMNASVNSFIKLQMLLDLAYT
jgi:hypothetical protein